MSQLKTKQISIVLLAGDIILLNASFYLGALIFDPVLFTEHALSQFLYLTLLWIFASVFFKNISIDALSNRYLVIKSFFRTCIIHILIIALFIFIFKQQVYHRKIFLLKYSLFIFMSISIR